MILESLTWWHLGTPVRCENPRLLAEQGTFDYLPELVCKNDRFWSRNCHAATGSFRNEKVPGQEAKIFRCQRLFVVDMLDRLPILKVCVLVSGLCVSYRLGSGAWKSGQKPNYEGTAAVKIHCRRLFMRLRLIQPCLVQSFNHSTTILTILENRPSRLRVLVAESQLKCSDPSKSWHCFHTRILVSNRKCLAQLGSLR